jgi:hypothetical protein
MLALNDEVLSRFASTACCGAKSGWGCRMTWSIRRSPASCGGWRRLSAGAGQPGVLLHRPDEEDFARGEFDVILTTEEAPDPGAEVLGARPLVWVGAPGGNAWQRRPLRLGFKDTCIFRPRAQAALDAAGIAWEMATGGESEQAVEATVAADLAVSVRMAGSIPEGTEIIAGDNQLPALGEMKLALYRANRRKDEAVDLLLAELRCGYGC